MPRRSNGIDVSEWQGKINWRKVAESGIEYAYIRACVGSRFVDSQCHRNHIEAKRNRIKTILRRAALIRRADRRGFLRGQ